jgi:glycerate kinase
MKIVIVPDTFKGSLASAQVAAAIAAGLRAELPDVELVTIPVADGGDGTVDAAVAATGTDRSGDPGASAAGGIGFAALAVLGAERRLGIELMLDLAGFDAALDAAALVITGEGSLDTQTLAGKAPVGVARAAARHGIPVVAVAGRSMLSQDQLAAAGITAVYALSDLEPDLVRSSAEASALLERVGRDLARARLAKAVTGP